LASRTLPTGAADFDGQLCSNRPSCSPHLHLLQHPLPP